MKRKRDVGSIEASDAMVKAANVHLVKTIPIGGGLITVLCKETSAYESGGGRYRRPRRKWASSISSHILARPHDDLLTAFVGDNGAPKK